MAPVAAESAGGSVCWREERLLHLLHVGRDCVDVQLVRCFVRLAPEEDAHAFLASQRKLCTSSAKTGLVKRSEATPLPRTPLEDHCEIAALGRVVGSAMDIFIRNGNTHVSYWHVADVVDWESAEFDCLRSHFTLPRLLAGFSLFDHNFQRKSCALSMRNFAVWGAEHCVKDRLLHWQGSRVPEALAAEALVGEDGPEKPGSGEFLSLVEVMRQLRWTGLFAPHVGDFLEWAWRCPGLELGVRVSSAPFASKDAQLESRDLSERSALHALVRRLSARPGLSEHIAACRQALSWREYGLGPLERFVKKYCAWFELQGELISLRPERAVEAADVGKVEVPSSNGSPTAPAAGLDGAAEGEADVNEVDEDDSDGAEDLAEQTPQQLQSLPGAARRGFPQLFRFWDGLPYDEICLRQALEAPSASLSASLAVAASLACSGERLEALGAEVAAFAQAQSLSSADWPRRLQVCQEVEATLRACGPLAAEFPSLRVRAFGTSASGLGQQSSDLDLLLDLDGRGNGSVRRGQVAGALEAAGAALAARADFRDLQLVLGARVPLLRGVVGGVRLDLTVGSRCGLWNTALLRQAAAQEPGTVVPLCVTVALWSKAVGINDSPNGLLSTYSLMLLVVFYLQVVGVLQRPDLARVAESVGGEDAPPAISEQASHAELGRLLLGFFLHLASFRWDAWVASVRLGAPLPRTQKPRAWQVQPLCVEDPFETHLNTCRRVNPRGHRQVLTAAGAALRAGLAGAGLAKVLGGRGPAASAKSAA